MSNGRVTEEIIISRLSRVPGWEGVSVSKSDAYLPSDYMTMALKLAILRTNPEGNATRVNDKDLLRSVVHSIDAVMAQAHEVKFRVSKMLTEVDAS